MIKFRRVIFTTLSLCCMVMIFMFSAQTASESSAVSDFVANLLRIKPTTSASISDAPIFLGLSIRKFGHITEYFILAIFVFQAVKAWVLKRKAGICALIAFIICYAYAALDEFHQAFVPNRGPSVKDTFIDSIGIIAALVISYLISEVRRARRDSKAQR